MGGPASTASWDYVNFQYFNITYGAEVKVTANPASAAPDKAITFTASVDNPPQPARWDWDWDFGDGTKDEEGRRRREPVTQLQG